MYMLCSRDKLDSDQNKKAVFSGYSTGPRIAGVLYDKHLAKFMKDPKKRVKIIEAILVLSNANGVFSSHRNLSCQLFKSRTNATAKTRPNVRISVRTGRGF